MGLIDRLHRLRSEMDRRCVESMNGRYDFFADELREVLDEVLDTLVAAPIVQLGDFEMYPTEFTMGGHIIWMDDDRNL